MVRTAERSACARTAAFRTDMAGLLLGQNPRGWIGPGRDDGRPAQGADKREHRVQSEALHPAPSARSDMVHVQSPFDRLIMQRKRLQMFFGYNNRFEAYVPKAK
jgi:hypothetical protein